jgi:caa(3)-type oxidase subunit IV
MADPHDKAHAGHDHGHAGHAHGDHGHGDHGHGEHHVHPTSHYVKVWAALIVLFIISVVGPMIGIKIVTLITAFGIAVVKASMVVKYFMHLDIEKRFVHYFLALSLAFMFLFFFAVAPDVMNHQGTNWTNVAAQHEVERGLAEGDGHGGGHAAPAGDHAPAGGEHAPAPGAGH